MPGRKARKDRAWRNFWEFRLSPDPRFQRERPASDQQGTDPSRGTDVSPGSVPRVGVPSECLQGVPAPGEGGPGLGRRGLAVGARRVPPGSWAGLSPGLFPSPTPCVPLRKPGSEHGQIPKMPRELPAPPFPRPPPILRQHQPLPAAAGLSAGKGRGGREGRGRRDVADKLRLFCRRQERGDEREAPGGSGCAV